METNFKLIQFVLANLHTRQMHTISDSISSTFVFSSPQQSGLNFEQYCEYVDKLSINFELEILQINSHNNNFTVDMIFNIIDNPNNFSRQLPATAEIVVEYELLQSIVIRYDASKEDVEYMDSTKPKLKSSDTIKTSNI